MPDKKIMSNRKRQNNKKPATLAKSEIIADDKKFEKRQKYSFQNKLLIVLVISFFSLSIFGAGLKYLEEDAKRQTANINSNNENLKENSLLNSLNPFLSAPMTAPTPQLSKEYIYAGSRLLAVEDNNANAAPPADLGIWRPSSGVWWVMGGGGSQQVAVQWGASTDKPAPGDFDGDGKTDFSVFRPSEGRWYVQRSSDNTFLSYNFGINGDTTAQADYDGDGRTDPAIFRSSNGTWYILRSSDNGVTYQQFGLSSDIPSPSDYDGDGKADITVWRNSNSSFYTLSSVNLTLQTATFSQTSNEPVSADYDGDGKADFAIRNGASWIIKNSSTSVIQSPITWQSSGDKSVYNDYDGDGKIDIAVWRDSTGYWYIRQSSKIGQSNELRQVQWGQSGDIPVPAFYRR